MSVFTPVTDADLAAWLRNYAIGRLDALQGISAGVQNSNFFVTTSLGRYVLTLFETMPRAELPFYLHLMAHLARHGLPVPAPIANRDNEYLGSLSGKPAVLVTRLAGRSEMAPDVAHCARIGAMLAGLHLAGMSFGRKQPNPRDAGWRQDCAARVRPHLPADERSEPRRDADSTQITYPMRIPAERKVCRCRQTRAHPRGRPTTSCTVSSLSCLPTARGSPEYPIAAHTQLNGEVASAKATQRPWPMRCAASKTGASTLRPLGCDVWRGTRRSQRRSCVPR